MLKLRNFVQLPTSAGDTSSNPASGRSRTPRGSEAYAAQPLSPISGAHKPRRLSPHAAATETHAPEPVLCNTSSHLSKKPAHGNQRKPACSNKDPGQPQIKHINFLKRKSIQDQVNRKKLSSYLSCITIFAFQNLPVKSHMAFIVKRQGSAK